MQYVLDPQIKTLMAAAAEMGLPEYHTLPVDAAREQFRQIKQAAAGTPLPLHEVSDRIIATSGADIPLRIYRPSAETKLPVLVYYHGGGWVIGDLDTHDGICRNLCREADCVVVSVDYRMAPEHVFPAAVDDAYGAAQWVVEHAEELGADPNRLAVGGDSAGGNLAAIVCQLARAAGGPNIQYQVLIYPATDMTLSLPSVTRNGEGYQLTRASMEWFINHYLPDGADKKDPKLSPLFATDLSKLPPALVITAGFDPLHDEGQAYADKLAAAEVEVEYRCFEGMIHGFYGLLGAVDQTKVAHDLTAAGLRKAFAQATANS